MGLVLGSCEGLLTWTLLLLLSAQSHGNCPAPDIPLHATLGGAELNDTYPVGSVLRFSCIPGYTTIIGAKRSVECLENSTWSTVPNFCQIKKCRILVLENGKVESSGDFQFGDEVNFTCNYGYRLLGPTSARCTLYEGNNVDWDKALPECERIPCVRPPRIANGTHSGDESIDHYTVGTVVTYTCNKDFSLIGHSLIECIVAEDGINGKWSGPAPECRVVSCPWPEIENGRLTSGFQPSYSYENVLQYECNAGYTILGDEFIKCIANSTWYPDPKCVKDSGTTTVPVPPGGNEASMVRCQRPEIANGILTAPFQSTYKYNHALRFVCNAGHTLVGSEVVICGADNKWHPALPSCVKGIYPTAPVPPGDFIGHLGSFLRRKLYYMNGWMDGWMNKVWAEIELLSITEKSLEDRLASIEKKLDLILLKVSQSCYQQTIGEDE